MRRGATIRACVVAGLAGAAVTVAGCAGTRLVVDFVPADDAMTETTVLEDDAPAWGATTAKIALIDVSGLMADGRRPGLLVDGENPVARFSESLTRAEDDRSVAAVVLRINSPGGTVTASDVMYRQVERFKERTGKPVVVLMGEVAASGGFYLACSGDHVIAHPTTITGSIGVIIQTINVADGLSRIGVHADSITSGPNKAMGSPLEPMLDEHRALLQGIVDEFYQSFREIVLTRWSGVSEGELARVTDGRIVTGRHAAEVGLVDETGDLETAFAAAKRLAETDRARLVKYHRPVEYVGSAYARGTSPSVAQQVNLLQVNLDGLLLDQPGFYYLWDPRD